jgi:hypothetical protein
MADWKQITARIRRARTSKDPAAQLSALYEKTHDAMVAFELAKYFETTGGNSDAAKWYGTAAEKFRRADWKTKAQEAISRLGGSEPSGTPAEPASSGEANADQIAAVTIPEPGLPLEQNAGTFESLVSSDSEEDLDAVESVSADGTVALAPQTTSAPADSPLNANDKRRRSRGRRGGRNRRKTSAGSSSTAMPSAASRSHGAGTPKKFEASPSARLETADIESGQEESLASRRSSVMPALPVETLPESLGVGPKGRYGDPGLSSRMSLLEMQFRRLLTCPAVKLEEANNAPVGPGVFVLTDSDLTSYYYVEACQTLRIAVANLLRGGSSRRGAESIKPQLAEHLGIAESRVPKYLADHCVVRWLQLDEGASHFSHFVIAVLRPILNE